ncbi:NitT/TauT family transport system permease protein [Comamonas sp. BIGb0124]|uniref:ABC transporter permease n=1 Tax=Comamonas sp. BIGb0124 TaxID=2485130 RepID=UPI000FAF4768|nr:ABC transporter permease [Comamonas sp. BIGb0124]ROR22855.1 NitT/TauT family transport system permease protein [Comamonas sp. BIGb0124]
MSANLTAHPPTPPAGPVRTSSSLLRRLPAATDVVTPLLAGAVFLFIWEMLVHYFQVSRFILPAPSAIFAKLVADFPLLLKALAFTASITLGAFIAAVLSGIAVGVLITQNRTIERILWPYAVALQVTPMVAIAPLVVIWVGLNKVWLGLLVLAWIVAFFPMLSNTAVGMKSADHGLRNVFSLYKATRWQRFRYLQLPSALPFILAGVRISSGLSVIGAVVAEFVAGSGSATGLAWIIVESGTMLDIARMFAALFMLSTFGLLIWLVMGMVQNRLLSRWHESEVVQEG